MQSYLGSSGHAHYLQYTALEKVCTTTYMPEYAYVPPGLPFFSSEPKKRASTKAFNYTDQFRLIIKLRTCHSSNGRKLLLQIHSKSQKDSPNQIYLSRMRSFEGKKHFITTVYTKKRLKYENLRPTYTNFKPQIQLSLNFFRL